MLISCSLALRMIPLLLQLRQQQHGQKERTEVVSCEGHLIAVLR